MKYLKSILRPGAGKRIFILDLLLLILISALFYMYIFQRHQLLKANKNVLQSYEVINNVERLQSLISDADVVAFSSHFQSAEPHNLTSLKKSIDSGLIAVKTLIHDNNLQQQRIEAVKTLLALHPISGSSAVNKSLLQNASSLRFISRQVREQLDAMKLMEYDLLRNRRVESAAQSKNLGVIRTALALFLLTLVIFFYFFYRKINFRAALSSELKQKRILLDNILDAVVITDDAFKITGFNKSAEKELGWKKEEMLGTSGRAFFKDFDDDQVKNIWYSFKTKGQWIGEVKIDTNGVEKFYQVTVTIVKNAKGWITHTVSLIRDVTAVVQQSQQVQQLLQRTESLELQLARRIEEANVAIQQAADAFIVFDKEYKCVQVNDNARHYITLSKGSLQGKSIDEIFPVYVNTPIYKAVKESMETGIAKTMTIKSLITGKWIESNMQPTRDGMIIYFKDVTDIKETQKKIEYISKELQKTRDEDRSRIAYRLHEDLGQQLTSIKVALSYLNEKTKFSTDKDAVHFQHLSTDLEQAINTVRKIAFELKPDALDESGLNDAIRLYVKQFEETTGITATIEDHIEDLLIENDVCLHLYRILQEALTNVARHSHAKNVDIELTIEEENIVMRITDDGVGFNTAAHSNATMGLDGMQERAKIINATCSIKSIKNKGTSVQVLVPLFPADIDIY